MMNKRIVKVSQGTIVGTDTAVQINDLECGHIVGGHFKIGQEVECRTCGRQAVQ
jgi:riboflavin synthase alpha subunit